LKTRESTSQETLFAVSTGVSTIVLGVIGVGVTTLADLCLLGVLGVGLFIVDPVVAIGTYLFFAGIGIYLYKTMNFKAKSLGLKNSNLTILSNQKILEVLQTYREAFVRDRRQHYAEQIGRTRLEIAETLAEQQFMPNISKYVIESSLLLGGFLVSALQFVMQDAAHAVATLSVFMAAGTRIAPAILRIQQGALSIKGGIASAGLTLELIAKLENVEVQPNLHTQPEFKHIGFCPEIEIKRISVRYPENSFDTISDLSLTIFPGEMIAIVGESGAGKSTLVDLLLGVLEPDLGSVSISGLTPDEAITAWPGAIGYVPQDSWLIDGTIAQNVALGFAETQKYELEILAALEAAQLTTYVNALPNGIESMVGERGTKMSGGQRQRVGIARALFTSPKLLVLDEATSSLDSQTEQEITQSLQELRGISTVVIIAHRLTTILAADRVV
jgi:ABC-type multidrug transport system fused ATPase/permease subunit